jgi:hypothetical protein
MVVMILSLTGCLWPWTKAPEPIQKIVSPPPVDKIQVPSPPPVGEIDRTKYQKFAPGKQEITVGKRGGSFFTADGFDWLTWRDEVLRHYIGSLEGQIGRHNGMIDKWKAEHGSEKLSTGGSDGKKKTP